MKKLRVLASAALLAMVASTVLAQPGPGPAAGFGPGASAPRGGPGPGRGMMGGGRWGSDFTPGWSMMTPQERQEHQSRMRSMSSYEDCRLYMDQHHQTMVARAQANGRVVPAQPRRDACAGLKR